MTIPLHDPSHTLLWWLLTGHRVPGLFSLSPSANRPVGMGEPASDAARFESIVEDAVAAGYYSDRARSRNLAT